MSFFPIQDTFQVINLTNNIVVSWPFSDDSNLVIADWNNVTGNSILYSITLPDATLAEPGQKIIFNNISAYPFQVVANDGSTFLQTIDGGQIKLFNLNNNSTANGGWDVVPFGGGTTAISAITAKSTNSSIIISNGAVTPPGGEIDFKLPTTISNFNNISVGGFPVLIRASTWNTRTITKGSNILVTNGDGIDDNPQISLANTLTELTSIIVGNLSLSASVIKPTNDQGISINSNSASNVNLNGVLIDSSRNVDQINNLSITGNLNVIGNLNITGTFNNIFTPKAWCYFTDSLLGISHIVATPNKANMLDVTGTAGQYTLRFAAPLNTRDYGVIISVGTDTLERGQGRPTVVQGFCISSSKQPSSFQIAVVDSNGEYVDQAPNGITVLVLSAT